MLSKSPLVFGAWPAGLLCGGSPGGAEGLMTVVLLVFPSCSEFKTQGPLELKRSILGLSHLNWMMSFGLPLPVLMSGWVVPAGQGRAVQAVFCSCLPCFLPAGNGLLHLWACRIWIVMR